MYMYIPILSSTITLYCLVMKVEMIIKLLIILRNQEVVFLMKLCKNHFTIPKLAHTECHINESETYCRTVSKLYNSYG